MTNERLVALRLRSGWTQAEVAELVGDAVQQATGRRPAVDAQAISRMERGEVTWPVAATRLALQAVFGVSSDADLGLFPKRPVETLRRWPPRSEEISWRFQVWDCWRPAPAELGSQISRACEVGPLGSVTWITTWVVPTLFGYTAQSSPTRSSYSTTATTAALRALR
ncbi:helix-turn-helix transcriptional regulator [Catenulispora sp. EB89]|uniref:helix-turn-helix transcriptional regulator n=1 Tax=Catenulispora sp. EB89 TaxID=3156257 RepID=UPI0035125DC9